MMCDLNVYFKFCNSPPTQGEKVRDCPGHLNIHQALNPFSDDQKNHRFLETNFTSRIVYLIIPRVTAFAVHTLLSLIMHYPICSSKIATHKSVPTKDVVNVKTN